MGDSGCMKQEHSFQATVPQTMCTVAFLVPGKAIQKSEDFHWKSYMYAGQQFFFLIIFISPEYRSAKLLTLLPSPNIHTILLLP